MASSTCRLVRPLTRRLRSSVTLWPQPVRHPATRRLRARPHCGIPRRRRCIADTASQVWRTTPAWPVTHQGAHRLASPTLLGLAPEDLVVVPELAYPTYEVGARLAGTPFVRADSLTQLGPQCSAGAGVSELAGAVPQAPGVDHLRKVVGWARDRRVRRPERACYWGSAGPSRSRCYIRRSATATTAVGHPLAVEDVVAGRLPRRLRRRRSSAGCCRASGRCGTRGTTMHAGAGCDGGRIDDDDHECEQRGAVISGAELCSVPPCGRPG